MISPMIQFHHVRSRREFNRVRSSTNVIRIRILQTKQSTLIDGDWFRCPWQLSTIAWHAISAFCKGRASDSGGGKACLTIRAKPEHAAELQEFLAGILGDPTSWLRWDRKRMAFLLLPSLEAAA